MEEIPIYGRYGTAHLRLCGNVFYDFQGNPKGFLVEQTIYDLRGQHRGFFIAGLVRDRMGKVVGFAEEAQTNGLQLPDVNMPPVPYKNLPAPECPAELTPKKCLPVLPAWSVMRLENFLV